MSAPVKISTGFPSAAKTAKKLGVSKKVANDLSALAELSLKTGEFVLPGVGRLVRVPGKSGFVHSISGTATKAPAKKAVKFRASKAAKDGEDSKKK
jgi:hypothetical protein